MATVIAWPFGFQIFDNNGNPASGAKVYSYVAGSSVTTQNTYTTGQGTVPNSNPVIADAYGRVSIFIDNTLAYHFVVTDSTGATTFLDQDNVVQEANIANDANNVRITSDLTNSSDYFLLTNSNSSGSYQPALFNSNIYVNLGTGTIYANAFSGAVTGNATTATTSTNIAGGAAGDLLVQTGSGTTGFLTPGTSGYYLTSQGAGTSPVWTVPPSVVAPTASAYWGYWNAASQTGTNNPVDINYQSEVSGHLGVTPSYGGVHSGLIITVNTTGWYFITATVTYNEVQNQVGNAMIQLFKNGANAGPMAVGVDYNNGSAGYQTLTVSGVIQVNAGSYLSIRFTATGAYRYIIGGSGSFCGFRIA